MPGPRDFQTQVNVDQLNLDPNKPTLLVVSDSAAIHSGFAQVVRNVFKNLWKEREWNIVQYGWWHADPMEKVPWPIITTDRDPGDPRLVNQMDKYGEQSFENTVSTVKPDMVWIMGDPWMIHPALSNAHSDSYTKILYIPVDGAPTIYGWKIIEKADVVVPYLPWGEKIMKRWIPDANYEKYIPHGVNTSFYAPIPVTERAAYRKQVMSVTDDDIVMISVSRNQSRKNLPALVEMAYYIRSGDYAVCSKCGKAYRNPYDYHMGRPTGQKSQCADPKCFNDGNPNMIPGKPNPKFFYYIHTPVNDLHGHSYKITDMLDVFGVGVEDGKDVTYPGFRWNDNIRPVHGISEVDLKGIIASSDIFSLATIGEGFGLPILEAMSCGVPVVVPDTSSHPDFVGEGGGILVPIDYHVCETLSTHYRGYPNLDDYLTSLLLLVNDAGLRKNLGAAARATALKYEWTIIAEQWRTLINKQMSSTRPAKRWHKLTTV